MMQIMELISGIVKVAEIIYTKANNAESNKKQSERLKLRVELVANTIKGLDKYTDAERFRPTLLRLKKCLENCNKFMDKFDPKTSTQKIIWAGTYKEKFADYFAELHQISGLLNLGISVRLLINQRDDRADQEADNELRINTLVEISAQNKEIYVLNQKIYTKSEDSEALIRDVRDLLSKQQKETVNGLRQVSFNIKQEPPRLLLDKRFTIPYTALGFTKVLAEDAKRIVHLGLWDGQEVEIQTIKRMSGTALLEFKKEAEVLIRLRSDHIVRFYGVCVEKNYEGFVIEYMAKGPFSTLLEKTKDVFTEQEKMKIALQVAKGLLHAHAQRIIHHNISPKNIFINADGQAKLGGFKHASINTASMIEIYREDSSPPSSVIYDAPEVKENGKTAYSYAADVYSLGVVLWEMFTKKPFGIDGRQCPDTSDGINPELLDLIRRCQGKTYLRISAIDLVKKLEELYLKMSNTLVVEKENSEDPDQLCEDGDSYFAAKRYIEAYECYANAAHQNFPKALYKLGTMIVNNAENNYINNDETKEEGIKLLKEAAEMGFKEAQEALVEHGVAKALITTKKTADYLAVNEKKPKARSNSQEPSRVNAPPGSRRLAQSVSSIATTRVIIVGKEPASPVKTKNDLTDSDAQSDPRLQQPSYLTASEKCRRLPKQTPFFVTAQHQAATPPVNENAEMTKVCETKDDSAISTTSSSMSESQVKNINPEQQNEREKEKPLRDLQSAERSRIASVGNTISSIWQRAPKQHFQSDASSSSNPDKKITNPTLR